jgi:hypothetical protein
MQHSLNKRLMSNANLLTTVSEGLEKNLKDYHPNRYVLFNGIYQLFEKLEEHQNEKFTICYTGSMYGENRNPEVLLKALKILIEEGKVDINKVQIKYAGKDFEDWKAWASKFQLNKILADCGYLTFKESFQLQRAAHINLLLTYTGKNYTGGLTGKLYEYLAAERPVMVIIRGEKDLEFESMINKLNAGTVLYSKEESVLGAKRFILNLFEQWKNDGDINLEMNKDVLKRYHWEEMIKNFIPRI